MAPQPPAPPSRRTRVRRHPERAVYDRSVLEAILDEGLVCHLGVVDGDRPYAIPTMYARQGDSVFIHGSPLSRMLASAAAAVQVCLTVTLLDGLVLARSAFNHSMNFRSVMVLGPALEVTEPAEKLVAFEALVEHVCRGRWADARPPSERELAATRVLRMDLAEASAKVRTGGPKDSGADLELEVWAGEVPLRTVAAEPVAHEAVTPGLPVPAYAADYQRPGWQRVDRTGPARYSAPRNGHGRRG